MTPDKVTEELCLKIFDSAGIESTPARMLLLIIILEFKDKQFSIDQIREGVNKRQLKVSHSSVIMIVKLFSIRGIIRPISHVGINEKAGRPKIVYSLSSQLAAKFF